MYWRQLDSDSLSVGPGAHAVHAAGSSSGHRSAFDECHASSPVRAGCRTSFRRPFLGFYRRDGLGIGATAADQRLLSRTCGHPAGGHFRWLGRAGRPKPTDMLSQPGGMDELQAFLSLLAASTGTWPPESAIWRSGVVISAGTPALSALETSPASTCLS